jgi:hypothetical protein
MYHWSQELTRELQGRAGVSATGTHHYLQHLLQASPEYKEAEGPEPAVHPAVALANLSAFVGTCGLAIALNSVLISHASNDAR